MDLEEVEDFYPLSPLQEGMLFHVLLNPKFNAYISQLSCCISSELDVPALKLAHREVIARHPALRTFFLYEGLKRPVQVVLRKAEIVLEQYDWREFSQSEQHLRLDYYLEADQRRGFNLTEPPLMRMSLIRLADSVYQLIWCTHHLLIDAWSTSLLINEFFAFYHAFRKGEKLSLPASRPYRDYIEWLYQQDVKKLELYWQRTLRGFRSPTPLPGNQSANSLLEKSRDYEEQHTRLSEATTVALKSLTRENQLTMSSLIQGVWALLLSCYSKSDDVVFGTIVSGRPPQLAGVETMIGLFINTLPVRVRVSTEDSLLSSLHRIQSEQAESRQLEFSALSQVQAWSEVPRGVPLFNSLLVFENYPRLKTPSSVEVSDSLDAHGIRRVITESYPLTLTVEPERELWLLFRYDRAHFDDAVVERMLTHFSIVLESIAADPYVKLSKLEKEIDRADEQQNILKRRMLKEDAREKLRSVKRRAIRSTQ